ncbi:MAG TPA: alpha/beta hydrolase [Thermoanaerobaculia bacterium]|nr:alpha/beta hydrolase [Thermoanaerobaculia bacterium]
MAISPLHNRIRIALAVFWLSVLTWMFLNMQARDVESSVLESGPKVSVTIAPETLTFTPKTGSAMAALVFYPGALADPIAYAPPVRAVAEAGFKVVIVKLPFRLALFDRDWEKVAARTRALIQEDDRRRAWVVGGHSRGAALAARFARDHASDVAGLLLVGTSHPRRDDLSGLALDVTKVYASEDGLASEEEIHQFAPNLPATTHWARVDGGNHAQFGWYGWQLGDGRARITRTEQQAITVRAVLDQLRRVAERRQAMR